MGLYRERTAVREARQVTEASASDIASWTGGVEVVEYDPFDSSKTFPAVNVPTHDGMERAGLNDWVVLRQPKTFEVLPNEYFFTKYESV